MRRLAALLTITVAMLVTTSGAASASPPSNDDINNATAITELPMYDVVDLSLATWDYETDSSRCGGYDYSVWYSFTPAEDGRIVFDPSASDDRIAVATIVGPIPKRLTTRRLTTAPARPARFVGGLLMVHPPRQRPARRSR